MLMKYSPRPKQSRGVVRPTDMICMLCECKAPTQTASSLTSQSGSALPPKPPSHVKPSLDLQQETSIRHAWRAHKVQRPACKLSPTHSAPCSLFPDNRVKSLTWQSVYPRPSRPSPWVHTHPQPLAISATRGGRATSPSLHWMVMQPTRTHAHAHTFTHTPHISVLMSSLHAPSTPHQPRPLLPDVIHLRASIFPHTTHHQRPRKHSARMHDVHQRKTLQSAQHDTIAVPLLDNLLASLHLINDSKQLLFLHIA